MLPRVAKSTFLLLTLLALYLHIAAQDTTVIVESVCYDIRYSKDHSNLVCSVTINNNRNKPIYIIERGTLICLPEYFTTAVGYLHSNYIDMHYNRFAVREIKAGCGGTLTILLPKDNVHAQLRNVISGKSIRGIFSIDYLPLEGLYSTTLIPSPWEGIFFFNGLPAYPSPGMMLPAANPRFIASKKNSTSTTKS